MNSVYDAKKNCSGCSVCAQLCPKHAITMQPDEFGFLYPVIDKEKCIDCEICKKMCHMNRDDMYYDAPTVAYAMQSKNEAILKKSQSGGAFAELAKAVLKEGGAVYGAAFDEKYVVNHIRIDNEKDLHKLQGSKYVQSNTTGIFEQVKNDLQGGYLVLFSGTPCQASALKTFLNKDYDNLYVMDFACHGVMPPKVWEDYKIYIKKKIGEFTNPNFRDKKFGWRSRYETFERKGKRLPFHIYRKIFFSEYFIRESCYNDANTKLICKYAGYNRVSDITVGDFWGIELYKTNIKNEKAGISLCLINTRKGQELFDKIRENVQFEEHNIEEIGVKNPHFSKKGAIISKNKLEDARKMYIEKEFSYIAKTYGEAGIGGLVKKVIRFSKRLINKIIR